MPDTTAILNAAKSIRAPISLAALALGVLWGVFSQIIAVQNVQQSIFPSIVNWIGVIALVAVVMSIISFTLPAFVKAPVGELEIGKPIVRSPNSPDHPL